MNFFKRLFNNIKNQEIVQPKKTIKDLKQYDDVEIKIDNIIYEG